MARYEIEDGQTRAAITRLEQVIRADAERSEAYWLLAEALQQVGEGMRSPVFLACAHILEDLEPDAKSSPSWAFSLLRATRALASNQSQRAVDEIGSALKADPSLALAAITAIKAFEQSGDRGSALYWARVVRDRWPENIYARFFLAEELIRSGRPAEGVEILHGLVASDPAASVIQHLLSPDSPYLALWPKSLRAKVTTEISNPFANPIPVQVVNEVQVSPKSRVEEPSALPEPEPWEAFQGPDTGEAEKAPSDSLIDIRRDFDRIAARINARIRPSDEEARIPAYIVLSSRTRLLQAFGEGKFARIDDAIMQAVEAVRRRKRWTAYRFYPDDPTSTGAFQLTPSDPGNPWQVKLRIADLDAALARRGEMIGAILIVGGDEIIPFHMLPNPTDDDDDEIPSDNPYATIDQNYFIPEWGVGRLPSDDDAEFLVNMLKGIADYHRSELGRIGAGFGLRSWVNGRLTRLFRRRPRSLGYSASIWKKASLAVFKTIGGPRSLMTSPPSVTGKLSPMSAGRVQFSYFNLHGLEESPEWFGQRDPLRDRSSDTDFPIALKPTDVVNSGRSPSIVFTEACYGANVLSKNAETALCLRFLSSGSRAVIGSTKISYGSVNPPLIAADLLGRLFWEQINSSVPVGEALRIAKLKLAAKMHDRQGFLDGEDQKTLISFVLYGDPFYSTGSFSRIPGAKAMTRSIQASRVKTVCALGSQASEIDQATSERIKAIVSQYLPGMEDAECKIHHQHSGCDGDDHACPSQQLGIKTTKGGNENTMVVSFAKHVKTISHQHPHFARLTLDQSGKVLKLAVSR
jgi:Flp pilus assembly protein TadD